MAWSNGLEPGNQTNGECFAKSGEPKVEESGKGDFVDGSGDVCLEDGEGPNALYSTEGSYVCEDARTLSGCPCSSKKLKSRVGAMDSGLLKKEKHGPDRKLSRQDRIELCRLFQGAVSSHDWELAESLILLADPQTLNDALCIALDSIWFLSTHQELHGITGLIKKIIANGAYDFTRAALRTSFLASCVSACQSRTLSLADTVTMMAQRQEL